MLFIIFQIAQKCKCFVLFSINTVEQRKPLWHYRSDIRRWTDSWTRRILEINKYICSCTILLFDSLRPVHVSQNYFSTEKIIFDARLFIIMLFIVFQITHNHRFFVLFYNNTGEQRKPQSHLWCRYRWTYPWTRRI